jgi:uncharacterized coiled-coil protein SlyX
MAGATRKSYTDMEELIERKFKELELTLASKKGIEDLKLLITNQNQKIERQNREISNMKDQIGVMSSSISTLKKQLDHQEQYSRRYCLRIKGIENERNETSDVCIQKVIKVCQKLNIDVSATDIDRAHRVGKDKKVMIVKFFGFKKRTTLYNNRKRKECPVKVYLDITKHPLELCIGQDKVTHQRDIYCGFCFCRH